MEWCSFQHNNLSTRTVIKTLLTLFNCDKSRQFSCWFNQAPSYVPDFQLSRNCPERDHIKVTDVTESPNLEICSW